MNAQETLLNRVSSSILSEPGPSIEQMNFIFQAALRAPDHARLTPWRFMTITGDARQRLGDLLAQIALSDQPNLSEHACRRFANLPLRAPCLIALICKKIQHAKVPEIEQRLSLGAAAQNILHAAYSQGLGAIWRTGAISYHPLLAKGLGLKSNEELLGFIYLGTAVGEKKERPELNLKDFVQAWLG